MLLDVLLGLSQVTAALNESVLVILTTVRLSDPMTTGFVVGKSILLKGVDYSSE
jgi:hypothetical protein